MRKRGTILIGVAVLAGCARQENPARIAEGCYRFQDGTPLFRVKGATATVIDRSGLRSFAIGPWMTSGREVRVTPAFVLHDGTASTPHGPATMTVAVTTIPSGVLRYAGPEAPPAISVPVEAYGWATVRLGKPC